jgi:hypothetical protein
MKFHENPSGRSRVFPRGQDRRADGHDEANSHFFSIWRKRLKYYLNYHKLMFTETQILLIPAFQSNEIFLIVFYKTKSKFRYFVLIASTAHRNSEQNVTSFSCLSHIMKPLSQINFTLSDVHT